MIPSFNPAGHDFAKNAYSVYTDLRAHAPIHKTDFDCYWLTRHADVKAALNHNATRAINLAESFNLRMGGLQGTTGSFEELSQSLQHYLLLQNGERHKELRKHFARLMDQSVIAGAKQRFEAALIIADAKLNSVDQIQAQQELATPIAVSFVCGLMGFPESDSGWIAQIIRSISRTIDIFIPTQEYIKIQSDLVEMIEYIEELLDRKRHEPDSSLLTKVIPLLDTVSDDIREGIFHNLIFLSIAASSTVNDAIGMFTKGLVDHSDQTIGLEDDSVRLGRAVEELLRFYSPAEMVSRITEAPIHLEDGTIEPGYVFWGIIASANRDERVYEQADRLILSREKNPHLSFGYGPHSCLGNHAARWELNAFVQMFAKHAPRFRAVDETLVWRKSGVFRGLEQLTLKRT